MRYPDEHNTLAVMYVRGKHLLEQYPIVHAALKNLFHSDQIRPMATYAVVFVRCDTVCCH